MYICTVDYNFAIFSITTDMDIFGSAIYPRNVLCIFLKTATAAHTAFTLQCLHGLSAPSIMTLKTKITNVGNVTPSRPLST